MSTPHALPPDPRLRTPGMQHEAAVVKQMRQAARAFSAGKFAEAQRTWDDLAQGGENILNPARLAYGRATARIHRNQLAEADALLATIDLEHAPFDVGLASAVDRGVIADRLGHRSDAIGLYRQARAYADTHPEYTDRLVAQIRALAAAGLSRPLDSGPFPETPALQAVPE